MEGVELYMLGEMDVVCQFCGAIGFKSKNRNELKSFGRRNSNGPLLQATLHCNIGFKSKKQEWTNSFWQKKFKWAIVSSCPALLY